MNSLGELIIYLMDENWPMALFIIGSIGGTIVWAKKQLLDNVYATKKELRQTRDELEEKMDAHEKADMDRYLELTHTINDNHDEIKTLIITTNMGKKDQ